MEELNQKRIDRAVLVGLNADCFPKEETATETTLDELEALLNTAGGECAGKILQNKHTPDPRSFIGEGKAEEVRQLVLSTGANMVIFDNDLTPSQTRTLEDILKTTVLDRSALILDIFAQRAKTREGKLQVELAQYQYYLPRLTVWNEEMGRLGGGIGTRGPGETQLETDKRYIRSRIQKLRENLEDVRKVRAEQRRRRQKNDLPVVALVGYTNAGKSTLLNRLTGADIPANNRLFDTLDTTTRQLTRHARGAGIRGSSHPRHRQRRPGARRSHRGRRPSDRGACSARHAGPGMLQQVRSRRRRRDPARAGQGRHLRRERLRPRCAQRSRRAAARPGQAPCEAPAAVCGRRHGRRAARHGAGPVQQLYGKRDRT